MALDIDFKINPEDMIIGENYIKVNINTGHHCESRD
jgi:hypothetical protein